jgi:hypothetical protein
MAKKKKKTARRPSRRAMKPTLVIDLLEGAKQLQNYRKPSWFDHLSPEKQQALLTLREAFQQKTLGRGVTRAALFRYVVERLGEITTQWRFARWINAGGPHG